MPALSRRDFLNRLSAFGLSAAAIPGLAGASALRSRSPAPPPRPIRIRGRVHAAQKGWGGVAVTDGVSVVRSDAEGYFELISNSRRPFAYLSLPSGSRIPLNPTGTARFYQPIQANRAGEQSIEFPLQRLGDSDEEHCFYQLADPQTQNMRDMKLFQSQIIPEIEKLAGANPSGCQFGFACGDIMYDDLSLYPEYEKGVRQMNVPFFQVVGNHDLDFESLTNPGASSTFQRHFGPAYYSFERGAVHYVVLNDVFWYGKSYLAYLDKQQLDWLAADLALVEAGRTVIVALHIPVSSSQARRRGTTAGPRLTLNNREALYRLLEPYQAHIISGHTHESEHVFEHGCHEHVSGAVCGAWWSGPICHDGTPNGYAVYRVRGEQVRWKYHSTGHDASHQMRLYPPGADPSAPDEVVANVWNWDPQWSVQWYEDGQRKGSMARRIGTDPLSEQLYRGEDLPLRHKWVEPLPTSHLFYAPVSKQAREVWVEAKDRFGEVFSEVLRV